MALSEQEVLLVGLHSASEDFAKESKASTAMKSHRFISMDERRLGTLNGGCEVVSRALWVEVGFARLLIWDHNTV